MGCVTHIPVPVTKGNTDCVYCSVFCISLQLFTAWLGKPDQLQNRVHLTGQSLGLSLVGCLRHGGAGLSRQHAKQWPWSTLPSSLVAMR